jgi:hypothetical protein
VCEGYTAARLEESADISGILAGSRPTSPAAETEQLCQMAGWPGVHVALSAVVGGNRDCQQRQPPQEQAQGRLGLRRRLPARPLYGQVDQRDRRAASCSATASGCGTCQIGVADSLGVRAAPSWLLRHLLVHVLRDLLLRDLPVASVRSRTNSCRRRAGCVLPVARIVIVPWLVALTDARSPLTVMSSNRNAKPRRVFSKAACYVAASC